MIHTDGTPTVAHRGALETALAEAAWRENADEPTSDERRAECCGDPGDCNECGS